MVTPVKDTRAMIQAMAPTRANGRFIFCTTADQEQAKRLISKALASFQEGEGMSLILPLDLAKTEGFDTTLPMVQITLQVHSALDGVGLTTAVATALADHGIPCNMVAGYHHDHAFVPEDMADEALAILTARAAAS
ncbi:ACT domain-containing protein [Aestuariivita boseongensis]|uniref:ACT domain-containing protein n=1 Tax=Aestuariivita boseongensis TaxID=1470562 RepID=UPI0006803351|nr:ACT domain-containing protein [Aestuariivita boseongensis]